MGVPNFERYSERRVNSNMRKYNVPTPYDLEKVQRGFESLSESKRPQSLVSIEKSKPRDESMYKIDKEVLRKIKLKLGRENFSFESYLPNGLKGTSALDESRNSLASTAASV